MKIELVLSTVDVPILKQLFYGTAFLLGREMLSGKQYDDYSDIVAILVATGGLGHDYGNTKRR